MSRLSLSAATIGLSVLLLGAQCDRAPAEPSAEAPRRTSPSAPSRCVRATPEQPPPAVPKGPDARCPPDPDGKPPAVRKVRVTFPQATDAPVVEAELMDTDALRSRGLMFRRELDEARGMLFLFEDESPRSFWMRNTCLPLDMVFVAADGFVVSILENVPTMNDDPRESKCAAKFVLELNAGFARRHGLKAGQSLAIEGL